MTSNYSFIRICWLQKQLNKYGNCSNIGMEIEPYHWVKIQADPYQEEINYICKINGWSSDDIFPNSKNCEWYYEGSPLIATSKGTKIMDIKIVHIPSNEEIFYENLDLYDKEVRDQCIKDLRHNVIKKYS